MTCIGTVKRTLVRLGIYPSPAEVEFKEAETDNLVVDRERVMTELAERGASFKKHSDQLEATTEQRKGDLEDLLDHIHRISLSTATARTLIERLIKSKGTDDAAPFQ